MYLKALEIQGFKSFPDKTRLTFEKNITAIVGPNGSGKSNLADALSWVLGEQSSKSLRGSKMEDVIFGGTAIRHPMGYAEVSLVLDNTSHIFDSDRSEIEITRRYFRSGDSEYYINREQVRLKDLNSLLMDTGLGRDGYSIIGQGRIAEIVSTKSSERREVFDEAAGISRYRYRKEEAERRLDKTEENLLRVNDKIEELELQVGPLKEQSETAKKYLVLRDELRLKEVSAWMETLDNLHEKAESVNLEYLQSSTELAKAKNELEALYASSESLTQRMHLKAEELEQKRDELRLKENESADISSAIEVLKTNIVNTRQSMKQLLSDIEQQQSRADEIRTNISDSEERLLSIDKEKSSLGERILENENVLAGCRMKLSSREGTLEKATDEQNRFSSDARYLESRINMLREMEKDYEGFSKAVKTVMKESLHATIRGVHGPLANLVRTDDEYALAIETALGQQGQHIVIDSKENAKSAIEMLKRKDSGRATFLPIDTIRGELLDKEPKDDEGYIGLAYDLVSFDEKYDEIVANVLGKTAIVENLSDAIRISKAYNDKFKIVTLDGQVISAGGAMTGGSNAKGTGILSRANEVEKLRKELDVVRKNLEDAAAKVKKARDELSTVRYQMDMALEDKNELNSKVSSLDAEEKSVKNVISQFKILLDSISGDSDLRREAMEKSEEEIERLQLSVEEKETKYKESLQQAEDIKKKIEDISASSLELEGKRTRTDSDTRNINEKIIDLERRTARIEQKKVSADLEEKTIIDKLWDSYELSHSEAQSLRQPVENLTKVNREISSLRKEISALGTPNIGAIEEYKRVSERYEFFTGQRDDVEKAKNDLLKIIGDLTKEMKNVFITQFKLIDDEFRKTFTELFGGGKASLVLEDEEDVLGCGIEIRVQPPGKALTSISLLSGGEMAFVAIALYFAIIKVRPTPFCVMDEIEAALDEANVGRFADYLRKMTSCTQFITITHRRGTMEEADMLYGVTMQEKGVSTVIELDLEQAKKTAGD